MNTRQVFLQNKCFETKSQKTNVYLKKDDVRTLKNIKM